MDQTDRKAAIAAYKERKSAAGIYMVRCSVAGRCWVGRAPDLRTIRNRLWFSLRCGNSRNKALQEVWRQHGEDSLTFEPLEQLDDKLGDYAREKTLKERLLHWQAWLEADVI